MTPRLARVPAQLASALLAIASAGLPGLCAAVIPAAAAAAPADSPWGASYFPNVPLVTHEGKRVRFYDDLVKDKHVVVSFIYTRCTQVCGVMTANLARVQRELGARVGRDIFFYSISMDGDRDSPEVLARYATAFKAGPGWTFLTGDREDVALLRKKFGDISPMEEHAAHVDIGNDRIGQWMSTSAVDNPRYLAGVIANWLDPGWGERTQAPRSYADAPPIPRRGKGEATWQSKCVMCHAADGESVGPALAGVTARRDRGWLARWIRSPGKLISEKDPLAVELVASHGGVLMPDVGLRDDEVEAVLDHLGSLRPGTTQPAAAPGR